MSVYDRPMPQYLRDEIEASAAYAELPWRRRLATPPPEHWPGGHLHRLIAWCARQWRWR